MTSLVQFYLPSERLVTQVPERICDYWAWINASLPKFPAIYTGTNRPCTWAGPYNWTIQTYMYLRNALDCSLTHTWPERGVVVSHTDFLPADLQPQSNLFVVEIKPDRHLGSHWSNFVLVQSGADPLYRSIRRLSVPIAFLPYWPQPSLIPRAPERGSTFQHVCFMGNPEQFGVDANSLKVELGRLGLRFSLVERSQWHDYSACDAVVAVRPHSVNRKAHMKVDMKPATKLYNSWSAGVPAVLSPDMAFEALRRSELDYLRATTLTEICDAVWTLKSNPDLRRRMMENGIVRARDYSPENIKRIWLDLFSSEILPRYDRWTASSYRRGAFKAIRRLVNCSISLS